QSVNHRGRACERSGDTSGGWRAAAWRHPAHLARVPQTRTARLRVVFPTRSHVSWLSWHRVVSALSTLQAPKLFRVHTVPPPVPPSGSYTVVNVAHTASSTVAATPPPRSVLSHVPTAC